MEYPRIRRCHYSATEYQFDQDQADAIIRTVAYHRSSYSHDAIWYSTNQHANIISSIATPFQRTANTGIGSLDRLPDELLLDILFRLDLHSLFKFRQLNLYSREIVDSLSEYRRTAPHALNLLCALLRTGLATKVSLLDFYDALCTKTCAFCGEFGGFLSLPNWKRCCIYCLQWHPKAQVRTLASLQKQYQMTKRQSRQLRSFKSLPGIYSFGTILQYRVTLASTHQASLVCKKKPPVLAQIIPNRLQKFNFMGSCGIPYYNKQTGNFERGLWCAGCQLAFEMDGGRGLRVGDEVYSQDSLLDHFRWCEKAQLLWELSDGGRIRPPELPYSVHTEVYFQSIGQEPGRPVTAYRIPL